MPYASAPAPLLRSPFPSPVAAAALTLLLLPGCYNADSDVGILGGTTTTQHPVSPYVEAGSNTWFVDDLGAGLGEGSFEDPFGSIQTAVDNASVVDGDAIIVLPGLYNERVQLRASGTSDPGKALSLWASEGPTVTAIDAQNLGRAVTIEDVPTGRVVLSGFDVRNGQTPEAGGAVRVRDVAEILIEDSWIRDSSTDRWGGGLSVEDSAGAIRNNQIYGNTAGGSLATGNTEHSGGGLFANLTTLAPATDMLEITGNDIRENVSAHFGGGVTLGGFGITFFDNLVQVNDARERGGGLLMRETDGAVFGSPQTRILSNEIERNTARVAAGAGLEMEANLPNEMLFAHNRVLKNLAEDEGGALVVRGFGRPRIRRCTFTYNVAPNGGGLVVQGRDAIPEVSNCKFILNRVPGTGAAIWVDDGAGLELRNCTLLDNRSFGGATVRLEAPQAGSEVVRIANSVIWSEAAMSSLEHDMNEPQVNHSLVRGGQTASWFGVGCLDEDPQLEGSGEPLGSSPVIQAGDPSYMPGANPGDVAYHETTRYGAELDLDGQPRVLDGRVEMGAYERGIGPVN